MSRKPIGPGLDAMTIGRTQAAALNNKLSKR